MENQWYAIKGAVVDRYRGALSMQINPGTATPLLEDRSIRPNIIPVAQAGPGIVCLRVKLVQEYENTSERIFQSGLLGDESGTIRFVTWKDDMAQRLVPDMVYSIYYASVDEFNGRLFVTLNGATLLPDEGATIQVRSPNEEVKGAFVHLSPGSGLIKRCPVEGCGRVLSRQNYCPIHEIQPNYIYDLRVKGWLDDGQKTYDTIISREGVEELTGLNLITAQEMAENNPLGLDTVFYHVNEQILGRYLICRGKVFDNRLVAYNCEFQAFDAGMLAELMNRAEGGSHE
jgi:replication factor A1